VGVEVEFDMIDRGLTLGGASATSKHYMYGLNSDAAYQTSYRVTEAERIPVRSGRGTVKADRSTSNVEYVESAGLENGRAEVHTIDIDIDLNIEACRNKSQKLQRRCNGEPICERRHPRSTTGLILRRLPDGERLLVGITGRPGGGKT
jgi:hypothetical protein